MRKLKRISCLLFCLLCLCACNEKGRVRNMEGYPGRIQKLDEDNFEMSIFHDMEMKASRINPEPPSTLDKVNLFFFSNNTHFIGVDFEAKKLYLCKDTGSVWSSEYSYRLSDEDIAEIKGLFHKYNIQSWDEEYSSSKTGEIVEMRWEISYFKLGFEDGTMEIHKFRTNSVVWPQEYKDFSQEIITFATNRINIPDEAWLHPEEGE